MNTLLSFKSSPKLFAVAGCCSLLFACQKDNPLVNASYPDQQLYMVQSSVAVSSGTGLYAITSNVYNQAQRFLVDAAGGKMNIPLGVYKAGVNTSGTYTVSIAANADTVSKLIAAGKFAVATDPLLTTELLPASAYAMPASIDVPDGSNNAVFNVSINLPFLVNSYTATPKKRYALAVGITSSKSAAVKTALATTVIFIDPAQIVPPMANFSSYIYSAGKTANFVNLAANGVSHSWNFGDGTTVVTDPSPSHVYAASGTYTVTLTTTGIAGSGAPSVKTATVVIP